MKGKKNDFSITFYNKFERLLFLKYVHNTNEAVKWFNDKVRKYWTHYFIYDSRNGNILDVIYKSNVPIYTLVFWLGNTKVYFYKMCWEYSDAVEYVLNSGIEFEYFNVYDYFSRQFIERIYI